MSIARINGNVKINIYVQCRFGHFDIIFEQISIDLLHRYSKISRI